MEKNNLYFSLLNYGMVPLSRVTYQEKGGPKIQDKETDDKSNKGRALMKADKKNTENQKYKIQNMKKLKQEEKTELTNHDDE